MSMFKRVARRKGSVSQEKPAPVTSVPNTLAMTPRKAAVQVPQIVRYSSDRKKL